jgi:hypothetical protein
VQIVSKTHVRQGLLNASLSGTHRLHVRFETDGEMYTPGTKRERNGLSSSNQRADVTRVMIQRDHWMRVSVPAT